MFPPWLLIPAATWRKLIEEDGLVVLHARFLQQYFPRLVHERLFATLRQQLNWREEEVFMFGRRIRVPWLVAYYGVRDFRYAGTLYAH